MNKKELFYKYTDFQTLSNIGASWVGQFKNYVSVTQWVSEAALYKIFLSQWHVSFYLIIAFVVGKYYFWLVGNWVIGKLAIYIGVYKAQQQYGAKVEHLNPYNKEVISQLEAIGEKLGVTSKFTKL